MVSPLQAPLYWLAKLRDVSIMRRWWPRKGVFFTFLVYSVIATVASATEVIRYPAPVGERDLRDLYLVELLRLALEKTLATHGPYQMEPAVEPLSQSRALAELASGRTLDVVWAMTSIEREQRTRPVRIPLRKGLLGYRLLIIREEDSDWFESVTSIDQLREVRAGQGHDWPDADILAANGLQVLRASSYDSLFLMLEQGRFDYLPRGLTEIWAEIDQRPEMAITVAPSLLLYYPTASYFFVAPDNTALAERLTQGLEAALKDGSFDRLFFEFPQHREALARASAPGRQVLVLENPLLPPETPLHRAELWYRPEKSTREGQRSH